MVSTNTRNLSSILELSDLMLAEANHAEIVEKIMDTAADMCDADGWFFYNVNDDKFLTLSYSVNKSLKITRRGSDNLVYAPTVFLPEIKNQPQKSIAAACFSAKASLIPITSTPTINLTTVFSPSLTKTTIMPPSPFSAFR